MNVNAISLNETSHFNIRQEDKPYIKEIRSTYCYDSELGVYLCELTPSHELRFLHTYIVWDTDPPSERKREELDDYYTLVGGEDIYMHVSDVRKFARNHPGYHKVCACECELIEEAVEQLSCNWPF